MRLLKKLSGYEVEYLPNLSFRLMSIVFSVRDVLFPVGKRLDPFGIRKGSVVVDFGCGSGSYLERASQLVGDAGKVYAVDVHPLAIMSIKRKAEQKNLNNVVPVLSTGYPVDIESQSADVIYALDMFHHVKDSDGFLTELHRLLKPNGSLFIESGHQPLDGARKKILKSDCWVIVREVQNLFECKPKEHGSA
jgi:ubiquinone/menaquinone biosynthesis C-methylase UbiE